MVAIVAVKESITSTENSPRGVRGGRRGKAAHLMPGGLRWILPGFIVSVGLIYYSIVYSGYLSFFNWAGGRQLMHWVGFGNYLQVFSDQVFWISIRNTAIYFVVVFTVQVVGGVFFAAVMHSKIWLANVYKVIIVIPVIVAPATMAPAHIQVWATHGTFNALLKSVGLGWFAQSWLGQSTTSLLVIILVACWGSIGFGFILYFGAMTQIDPEMIEAGRIDGASNLRILVSLIFPNVRAITISLAILNLIAALKLFDNPWLITQGGPANSSDFLGTMIYAQTVNTDANLGYASALSIVLLAIAIPTAIVIQLRSRERREKDITPEVRGHNV